MRLLNDILSECEWNNIYKTMSLINNSNIFVCFE